MSQDKNLRPYMKPLRKINSTQATSKEGEITIQTDQKGHPLIIAWLDSQTFKKSRFVLCCLECGFYEELFALNDEMRR